MQAMSIILLVINFRHRSGNGNHQHDSRTGQNKRSRWPIHRNWNQPTAISVMDMAMSLATSFG